MNLLAKTRKISGLMQQTLQQCEVLNFDELAQTLGDLIKAHIYILDTEGALLGVSLNNKITNIPFLQQLKEKRFSAEYIKPLAEIKDSMANVLAEDLYGMTSLEYKEVTKNAYTTLIPIRGNNQHLGMLILSRGKEKFVDDDLILGEYGATLISMEMLREQSGQFEEEVRSRSVVNLALRSLSFSELEAALHIFGELSGKEGLLVASKIADRVGITRSVIVNALRKLEGAGVVESRSLGMKGTYIKVLNSNVFGALEKARH